MTERQVQAIEMRRFAFSYYVGVLILVFFLYAGFLKAVLTGMNAGSSEFFFGISVGALAIIAILVAIGVAWKANGSTR